MGPLIKFLEQVRFSELNNSGPLFFISDLAVSEPVSTRLFIPQKIIPIWDQLGLNFNAINLKFLEIVGHKAVYNKLKFLINSLKIEVGTNFFTSDLVF